MARVQVEYQGDRIRPQVVPVQHIQSAQARFDPNDSTAFQLAKALGAIDANSLGASGQRALDSTQDSEKRKALAYANSMTVEDLGKKIRSGEMLPSKSPAFVAALQHFYGENSQNAFERDTLSRIQTGQLKFETPEELEKYLVEGRNGALEGQSEFTTAGYDKGFAAFRERAIAANTNLTNQQAVERGIQTSSDNLGNVLLQVTQPGFKGDPAQALVDRYQLLRKTSLLRDDAAKEALNGLLTSIAASGRTELAQALLDKNLDNGVSVRAVVGDIRAETILKSSEAEFDKGQRQRVDVELRPFLEQADRGELDAKKFEEFAAANEKYVTTQTLHAITNANRAAQERALRELQKAQLVAAAQKSEAEANQLVGAAIRSGNLSFLPQQKVMTPTGEVKDFDTKAAAQRILSEDVERMQMPLGKATEYWATNNVENPEWQKEIQAGASNIASVGWSSDGKNIGQLNEQGQRAIETFMRINKTHPGYAEKLVGNGKDYKMLSDIQFLYERGGYEDINRGAALVNQVNRSDIKASDYGTMAKQVSSAVDEVVNPGWFSGTVQWWKGMFGNDQVNLTSVQADIRRRAELLVMSGQVPNAQAAVKASVEYLANPAVTTKINNTLYFNKDLPSVPKGEDPGTWMERFIEEVPGKTARDQKMSGAVRLEPNQYGGFTAWVGGQPLINADNQVVTFRKEELSQWIDGAYRADQAKAMADRNYELWREQERKRIWKEAKKMGLTPFAPGADGTGPFLTREVYERLLREGKIK
jgi:hypothetical protein